MQTWYKRIRSGTVRHRSPSPRRRKFNLWLSGFIGIALAVGLIARLEIQLWPVLNAMATAKVHNVVTQTLDGAIADQLAILNPSYNDLITIDKDSSGRLTALTSNMLALNELRTGILRVAVAAVETMDPSQLSIPVGNLTGINFLSGRGFEFPMEVVAVGSAHAEFQNYFLDAGINQTRHQIMLDVTITVDILLPGDTIRTDISAQVPIAETIIVGTVPDTYLQFGGA